MRLKVSHHTHYHYDEPVGYALQKLRLMPKNSAGQDVLSWSTEIEGGAKQAHYTDQHRNHVELISFNPDCNKISIHCEGEVESTLNGGIVGKHIGLAPLWYFTRTTPLTEPGPTLRKFVRELESVHSGDIERMHQLMAVIATMVAYRTGETDAGTSAEEALINGAGVCQDHAHIFIAAARLLGHPARYVSGYLLLEDRIEQEASHAWAEVHLDAIGWVGFDVSNQICPDERYIRVATGLDYKEAAPMAGMRFGNSDESMIVSIQVQQ